MTLRMLKEKDAIFMFEWMHDPSVVKYLHTNFMNKTMNDCFEFIKKAQYVTKNLHLAIVNDADEYLGTVSLKDIAFTSAEFAITVRKSVMGTGVSKIAMREMLRIGFEELKLKKIYWCVSSKNIRAIHFYDKNRYERGEINTINYFNKKYTPEEIENYIWYEMVSNSFNIRTEQVLDQELVNDK